MSYHTDLDAAMEDHDVSGGYLLKLRPGIWLVCDLSIALEHRTQEHLDELDKHGWSEES